MKYYYFSLLLLLTVSACSGEKQTGDSEDTITILLQDTPAEVTIIPLAFSTFNHELISNGKLAAKRYADMLFESAAPIEAIYVKNGDRVTKGQKLATLSTFRLANKLKQTKTALDLAQLELQDVLIGQGYTPEDTLKIPAAVMQLARTRSGYDKVAAEYQIAVYEEQHATLTAPFNGIVANLFTREQNIASTTEAFCTILDPQSLEASFTVLESELGLIRTGDGIAITPFSIPEGKTTGQITEINPVVDKTGMVQVKASVTHNNRLFEGMNVRINIQRALPEQLVIPKEAVVLRSGKEVVFTLVNGKAYWNYVKTGLENSTSYTITDGLKAGDEVITSGNINLAHESAVTVIGQPKPDSE